MSSAQSLALAPLTMMIELRDWGSTKIGATPDVASVRMTYVVSMPLSSRLRMVLSANMSLPTRVTMRTSEPSREAATA